MFPSLAAISEAQSEQLHEVFPLWVVGKGEDGNPDTSARESRNGTQEYRSEEDIRERDKGFYRGQLERTGRHRI